MNLMKKLVALLLAVVLCIGFGAMAEETDLANIRFYPF